MRKVFSSKTSLLIERRNGEINDNKDGNNDNIFREYIRKTPWAARSTFYDLQRWGKNDNFIRTVNCFVVVKTDINNHKKPNRK